MINIFFLILSFNSFASIKYNPVSGYSESEKEVLKVAEKLSNEMAQSKLFESFMIERNLIDKNGKKNLEIVNHIKNASLTVPVHMYHKRLSKVVGYRQPPRPDIYTNRKFHSGATACARASNLMHEWSHVLGYGHSFKAARSRPYSVPYSVNAAFKKLCQCNSITDCKIGEKAQEIIQKVKCYRTWYTLWIGKKCFKIK